MYSAQNIKNNIVITIILTVIMPIFLARILYHFFDMTWVSIPLHAVLETSGGVLAIVTSLIFYIKYSKNLFMTHFTYLTIALLVMGIIDIFHAAMMPGKLFIWLHSCAVFFGGIFFMSVWFNDHRVSHQTYINVILSFSLFAVVFSIASIIFPSFIPQMLNSDQTFTTTANTLNIIGGLGFFIASFKLMLNYIKTHDTEEILFAGHSMLFGVAGILFVSSVIWDVQWWLWHFLRLLAYIIVFDLLYIEYRKEIHAVVMSHHKLSIAQKKIEDYVDILDQNVITSKTDKEGTITYVSQAFCNISGYTKEELLGQTYRMVRHRDMPDEFYTHLWNTISSGKSWHGEIKNRRKDGSFYWVDSTITPQFKKGKIIGYTAIKHNITNQKIIEILSITDSLTKLYNRRYFNKVFENEFLRAKRDGKYFSFIMLDVDHFKDYNDRYGHQEGDAVLESLGTLLQGVVKRTSDFAFRLGGEEFGIVFSDLDPAQSFEFAKSIQEGIENLHIKHRDNTASTYVTASLGLVTLKGEALVSSEKIYLYADELLYQSKEQGRNRVSMNIKLAQ